MIKHYTFRVTFPNGVIQTTTISGLSASGALKTVQANNPEATKVELIDVFEGTQ